MTNPRPLERKDNAISHREKKRKTLLSPAFLKR